jgi:hypothetical protein
MSGWSWVVLGLTAWVVLGMLVSFGVGAALRAAERRAGDRRYVPADEFQEPPGETGWPAAG